MNRLFLWFVKITGWPIALFYYQKKVICLNNDKSLKKIKGAALLVSNHTSVYDYPLMMYTFLNRSIRTLVAEIMYQKTPLLSKLLFKIGAIKVDRNAYDFAFLGKMIDCLNKGQVGLVYPEARVPKEEERGHLLEFKPSYVYMALEASCPIIPIYTNGIYGKLKRKYKDRAKVVIGKPIDVASLYKDNLDEKENINNINNYVKEKIEDLKLYLEQYEKEK